MSRMTQNSASDHNFKVKEIEKVKFYILNDFFVHKLKQTYIENVETVIEITKKKQKKNKTKQTYLDILVT